METKKYTNEIPKQRLIEGVIAISNAKTWLKAIKEFDLEHLYQEDGKSCQCGKTPIKNVCVVRNRETQQTLEVGNCCIEKFFVGMSSNIFFQSLNKLKKDNTSSLSLAVVQELQERKMISEFEAKFYTDIQRKRKLSVKQKHIKFRINNMFIKFFSDADNQKDAVQIIWGETFEKLESFKTYLKQVKDSKKLGIIDSMISFLNENKFLSPKQQDYLDDMIFASSMVKNGSYNQRTLWGGGSTTTMRYRNNQLYYAEADGLYYTGMLVEIGLDANDNPISYKDKDGTVWHRSKMDEACPYLENNELLKTYKNITY